MKLSDEHAEIFASYFSGSRYLTQVDLSQNEIGNAGCKQLEPMITSCVELREIYLGWNKISGEGAQSILDAVRKNGRIRVLDLSKNAVGLKKAKFLEYFGKFVKTCNEKNLLHLDLSQNLFPWEDGRVFQQFLKYNQSIYGLHVNGHGWFVNSRGFLKLGKEGKVEYNQLNYILPGVPKQIRGCAFNGYNEIRHQIS